jgi:hypothetical protein
MRRQDAYVGLIRSTVLVFAIGFAWSSPVLADEPTSPPAPSDQSVQERAVPPVVEGEPGPPPEAGDVQERAIRRDQEIPDQGIRDYRKRPETITPTPPPLAQPAPKVMVPGVVGPLDGVLALPDPPIPPTVNLAAVVNGMSLRQKSLTTVITFRQGPPLTAPVEISIGYYSPAGNARITQPYNAGGGNRFLYHDKEGDGKPRLMRVDISFMERLPGGWSRNIRHSQWMSLSTRCTTLPLRPLRSI